MSLQSGTLTDCLFTNTADYTAYASSNSEATLLAGANLQPVFYRGFFAPCRPRGVAFDILARGTLSTTATPTITFKVRMGTSGALAINGTVIGASAAITTGSHRRIEGRPLRSSTVSFNYSKCTSLLRCASFAARSG